MGLEENISNKSLRRELLERPEEYYWCTLCRVATRLYEWNALVYATNQDHVSLLLNSENFDVAEPGSQHGTGDNLMHRRI